MAKVKNGNGAKNTTSEGMSKYSFQGSPIDQFEHKPTVGERRVMSCLVECVHEGNDIVKDGERHVSKWKVLEAEVGSVSKRPASDEPELPYESGANAEYGDYGVASPPSEDGPDDEVGEDGYTNAERKAAAEGDTPTTATESDGGKIVRPSFSGATDMAAKQQSVTVYANSDGDYGWVREAKNSATLARSHRKWDTPGLAVKNALAVNRPPFQLVTPKETRQVTE